MLRRTGEFPAMSLNGCRFLCDNHSSGGEKHAQRMPQRRPHGKAEFHCEAGIIAMKSPSRRGTDNTESGLLQQPEKTSSWHGEAMVIDGTTQKTLTANRGNAVSYTHLTLPTSDLV